MRRLFSPVFFSTDAATGRLEAGLSALPPTGAAAPPLLLLGNHQLYGFDGPLILEEMLREKGVALTALVYPPLLDERSPLAPFPYPLPGTASTSLTVRSYGLLWKMRVHLLAIGSYTI